MNSSRYVSVILSMYVFQICCFRLVLNSEKGKHIFELHVSINKPKMFYSPMCQISNDILYYIEIVS